VKISRLTGPATFNLTDDMNIKQGYKDFFMSLNSFFLTSWKLKILPFFQEETEVKSFIKTWKIPFVDLDIHVRRLSPLNRSTFIEYIWIFFFCLMCNSYHVSLKSSTYKEITKVSWKTYILYNFFNANFTKDLCAFSLSSFLIDNWEFKSKSKK
jgi:hypothetical protein